MKKGEKRIVLFASIPRETHDALRLMALKKHKSMAAIVREAIDQYLARPDPSVRPPNPHEPIISGYPPGRRE